MAVENLWTLGGKPSSYNPLPTGLGNNLTIGINSYLITFKAKSDTSASLRVYTSGNVLSQTIVLTNQLITYEYTFNLTESKTMYFQDLNSTGNIIIQDIQLVRKPLPKPTINGIDGFQSGKWTKHANATIVDDEELRLNATGNDQSSTLTITGLTPNKDYTLSFSDHNGTIMMWGNQSNTWVISGSTSKSIVFNSGVNVSVSVHLTNRYSGAGIFTFKRPQLVLGSQAVPYSKKTGDRMVMPSVVKNLFNSDYYAFTKWTNVSSSIVDLSNGQAKITNLNYATPRAKCVPFKGLEGKQITVSIDVVEVSGNQSYKLSIYNVTTSNYLVSTTFTGTGRKTITVQLPPDSSQCEFWIHPDVVSSANYVVVEKVQFENSTFPTTYAPFAVSANKRAIKKTPKGNLLPPFHAWTRHANFVVNGDYDGTLNATAGWQNTTVTVDVKPNTNYYYSAEHTGRIGVYKTDGTTAITAYISSQNITFNSGNETKLLIGISNNTLGVGTFTFRNPSLVEGSAAKPFAPLEYGLRPARKGLAMDGVTNYLQLPSMTMDSVEIDCMVSSGQLGKFIVEARPGLPNGYFWTSGGGTDQSGSGWSSVTIDGINFTNPFPKNQRMKVKLSSTSFTEAIDIFNSNGSTCYKGTIYSIKCLLNGAVVANYDFTKPDGVNGTQAVDTSGNGRHGTIYGGVKANVKSARKVPKKNLVKPFTSKDWVYSTYSGGGTRNILSDYEIEVTPSANNQQHGIVFSVKPNTTYVFSKTPDASYETAIKKSDGTTHITSFVSGTSFSFNSGTNDKICVYFRQGSGGTSLSKYVAKNFMLEESSAPTSFEPYTEVNRDRKR